MREAPVRLACAILAIGLLAGCSNPFGRQYEYEEDVYLRVDGAAEVVVDASIPALVALRNLPLDPAPGAVVDREAVRGLFAAAACGAVRVGRPWTRHTRTFIEVRLDVADVRQLGGCSLLGSSTYRFEHVGNELHYFQTVGPAANGNPGNAAWTGAEIVAFRLHLPSRILYHNVKRLEDGKNGAPTRGNILTWEQRLSDRIASVPVSIEVRTDAASILYRTLGLFIGAFVAAVAVIAGAIWITIRRAKRRRTAPAGAR